MNNEILLETCNEMLGDIATELARAYVDNRSVLNIYFGQGSPERQLELFHPLAWETSIFFLHLLASHKNQDLATLFRSHLEETPTGHKSFNPTIIQRRLDTYAHSENALESFANFCDAVTKHEMNRRINQTGQHSINDHRYVTIQNAAVRILDFIKTLESG